jgi:hypothetical protein
LQTAPKYDVLFMDFGNKEQVAGAQVWPSPLVLLSPASVTVLRAREILQDILPKSRGILQALLALFAQSLMRQWHWCLCPQVRPMPPALAAVPGQAQQACLAFIKVRACPAPEAAGHDQRVLSAGVQYMLQCLNVWHQQPMHCSDPLNTDRRLEWMRSTALTPRSTYGSWWAAAGASRPTWSGGSGWRRRASSGDRRWGAA